jgi:hypothetical protein
MITEIDKLVDEVYRCQNEYDSIAMMNVFGRTQEERQEINRRYHSAMVKLVDARKALADAQNIN